MNPHGVEARWLEVAAEIESTVPVCFRETTVPAFVAALKETEDAVGADEPSAVYSTFTGSPACPDEIAASSRST